MQQEELRIGNLFFSENIGDKIPLIVIEISSCVIYKALVPNALRLTRTVTFYLDMNPIPLTDEWLLKFGLTESSTMPNYFTIDNKIAISTINEKYTFIMGNFVSRLTIREIKYVHELQNLYYAITGEELKYIKQ